jgi:hypothetical protein
MTKSIRMITLLVMGMVILSACRITVETDSGPSTTETRNVSGFHAVQFTTAGSLDITLGEMESLTIEAGENILPHLTTEVEDGVLVIGYDMTQWPNLINIPIKFHLVVKDLDAVSLSGAGNVEMNGLDTTNLKVTLSGAGNINLKDIQASMINTKLSGAGNISLSGDVDLQQALLTGVGNYQADDLKSQTATILVTGAGSAQVWVEKELDVTISGAGSVGYYGYPDVTQDISGLGSVHSLGSK